MKQLKFIQLAFLLLALGWSTNLNAQFCPVMIEGTTTLCTYISAAPGQPVVQIKNYDWLHPSYYSISASPSGSVNASIIPSTFSVADIHIGLTVNNNVTDIKITVTYNSPSCSSTVDYYLYKCCEQSGMFNYFDTDISAMPKTWNPLGFYEYNGLNVAVNGVLTVNSSAQIINSNFFLAPGSVIKVKEDYYNPVNIKLMNTRFLAGCDEMWKGIELEGANSITLTNTSSIEDAQYAINFKKGGTLHIGSGGCNFNKNFVSIYAPDVSSLLPPDNIHNIVVNAFDNANFSGQAATLNNYMGQSPAIINNKTLCGILLYDVANFQIPQSVTSSLRSNFSFLNSGIAGIRSNIEIHNCAFNNVQPLSGYSAYTYSGSAVFNLNNTTNYMTTTIGKLYGNYSDNLFTNCYRATYTTGNINATIRGNDYNVIAQEAAFINNCPGCNITITNNKIVATNMGIKILSSTDALLSINNNNISSVFPYNSNSFGNTAIQIYNKSKVPVRGVINNNTISNCRIGIYLSNLDKNKNINVPKLEITNNPMYFNLAPNLIGQSMHYAIWADGCNNLNIHDNQNIYRSHAISTAPANFDQTMRGIYIRKGQSIDLKQNDITNFGTAIRLQDNCSNTQLQCNNMYSCLQGVFLNDGTTIVTTQGNPATGQAWDNKWVNFGTNNRTACPALAFPPPVQWLHQGTAMPGSSNYSIFSPFPTNGTFVNAVQNSGVGPCVNNYAGDDEESMLNHIDDVIAETVDYDGTYETEDEYKDRQAAFEYLHEHESYRNSDAGLLAFYNQTLQENIGEFSNVEMLMRAGDYVNALMELNGILVENLIEQYRAYTLEIAIRMEENPEYELSQAEIDELLNIAYTPLYIGGEGVLNSRAILGLEVDDQAMSLRVMNPHNNESTKTLAVQTLDETVLKTLVYDNIGAKVLEGSKFTNADLRKALPSGVYIIKTIKQSTSSTKKVSIIK